MWHQVCICIIVRVTIRLCLTDEQYDWPDITCQGIITMSGCIVIQLRHYQPRIITLTCALCAIIFVFVSSYYLISRVWWVDVSQFAKQILKQVTTYRVRLLSQKEAELCLHRHYLAAPAELARAKKNQKKRNRLFVKWRRVRGCIVIAGDFSVITHSNKFMENQIVDVSCS